VSFVSETAQVELRSGRVQAPALHPQSLICWMVRCRWIVDAPTSRVPPRQTDDQFSRTLSTVTGVHR
jgi:hypothetical protein